MSFLSCKTTTSIFALSFFALVSSGKVQIYDYDSLLNDQDSNDYGDESNYISLYMNSLETSQEALDSSLGGGNQNSYTEFDFTRVNPINKRRLSPLSKVVPSIHAGNFHNFLPPRPPPVVNLPDITSPKFPNFDNSKRYEASDDLVSGKPWNNIVTSTSQFSRQTNNDLDISQEDYEEPAEDDYENPYAIFEQNRRSNPLYTKNWNNELNDGSIKFDSKDTVLEISDPPESTEYPQITGISTKIILTPIEDGTENAYEYPARRPKLDGSKLVGTENAVYGIYYPSQLKKLSKISSLRSSLHNFDPKFRIGSKFANPIFFNATMEDLPRDPHIFDIGYALNSNYLDPTFSNITAEEDGEIYDAYPGEQFKDEQIAPKYKNEAGYNWVHAPNNVRRSVKDRTPVSRLNIKKTPFVDPKSFRASRRAINYINPRNVKRSDTNRALFSGFSIPSRRPDDHGRLALREKHGNIPSVYRRFLSSRRTVTPKDNLSKTEIPALFSRRSIPRSKRT